MESSTAVRIRNFGRNVSFKVKNFQWVRDTDEALALLNQQKEGKVRVCGARHSWNESFATHATLVDISALDSVQFTEKSDQGCLVTVGAGCSVDALLTELAIQGFTLPGFGIIGKQSIAGAISTATHGSGFPSLSNAVTSAKLVAFDKNGQAERYQYEDMDEEIEAVRCALGGMGVLLELTLAAIPRYLVTERTVKADSLDELLDRERDFPLQQFYLVPHVWGWYAHLRKRVEGGQSSPRQLKMFYLRRFLKLDLFFNGVVKILSRPWLRWLFPAFYRLTWRGLKDDDREIVDYADRILRMKHDLYRHVEMELFVPEDRFKDAAAFVEGFLRWCDGEVPGNFGSISQIVAAHGGTEELAGLKGSYLHHYPVTVRRVLKDESMISMTHDGAAYAISFISYRTNSGSFEAAMRFLASITASAFGARPHWGKLMYLNGGEIEKLYPRLNEFRKHCEKVDPDGVFRNRFMVRKLWSS